VLDRIIGGWSLDGIARIQSGRMLSLTGVRLVGMTEDELQDVFKLRFDHAGKLVYNLPEDIIENTVRAFNVSATSATGFSERGVPEGRYLAPESGPDCIAVAEGFGECGNQTQIAVTGPSLYRFEFRAELLNAFNTPWFSPVFSASDDPDDYRVTGASGGREVQLVFRVNW
jgi:hypothetical protein